MSRPFYNCDICKKFIKEKEWYDKSYELKITVFVSGKNPMAILPGVASAQLSTYEQKEVCEKCRLSVATAITDAIAKIIEKREED